MKSKIMKKVYSIFIALLALVNIQFLHAEAIIAGVENMNEPYAAIVDAWGVATKVTGDAPQPNGVITSARMNSMGHGIIGGYENGNIPYMAFVSPAGIATKITAGGLPTAPGQLFAVAINESGAAIVGGYQNPFSPYGALISPSGVATPISGGGVPVGVGALISVSINASGAGIIGGQDNGSTDPYAAIVTPSGVTTAVFGGGAPTGGGTIYSVAINDSGAGIIGGQDNGSNDTYAAVISPSGAATEVFGPGAPTGAGEINSVAINNSGTALIGGQDNNVPYAALVSSTGSATPLSGFSPLGDGTINRVDINSFGGGIIGGEDNNHNDPYAALISPGGAVTVITGDLPGGNSEYTAVAINEVGVGFLGASDASKGNAAYGAIVSPSGVATLITGQVPQGTGIIFTADIIGNLLAAVEPKSFGPGNTFADPIVALSAGVLTTHLRKTPEREPEPDTAMLTADAGDRIRQPAGCERANYAIWGAPFGLFATYDKGHSFPKLQEWSAGGILGFDYLGWDNVIFGGGAAYSFQHVDYKSVGGHAEIHQELLTLYAAWRGNHISIHGALWGGIYQMHNKRKTFGTINSTSNIDGGIFSPHIEVGAPFKINNTVLTVEPFVMFDWVNNWQGSIKEKGSSGLNIRMDSHYVSLLRSEVGLHLTQRLHYRHGGLTFEESGSYVNRAPFNADKEQAYFVGSAINFNVQLFSNRVENLGALRLSGRYVPCNINYPYVALSYLGEFGANLILNTFALEVGKRF